MHRPTTITAEIGEGDQPAACSCRGPGFCQRFGRAMSARQFELCRTRPDYRRLWGRLSAGGAAPPGAEDAISPITPASTADELAAALNGPPRRLPAGWWTWNNVCGYLARAADDCLKSALPYPAARFQGRGIVICGGGKYYPSVYVTVRAIRHAGCELPIQVWYLGRLAEMNERMSDILRPLGVECIDADVVRRLHPFRILNGFQLKPYATLHSPFEEVLYLDADCYPVRPFESVFDTDDYRTTGATFWPDAQFTAEWIKWEAFQVASDGRPPHETGLYLLDKRKAWPAMLLALWYNEHSDFTYRHQYGDKELWHIALAKLARGYAMYQAEPQWRAPAYIHAGPDLEPMFVHRVRGKFVLEPTEFYTPQTRAQPQRTELPLEAECFTWLDDLRRALDV